MAGELQHPSGGTDPAQLRISDEERHQVAEILRRAAGEGRLDIDELDQRLEQTYAARTYADLVPITLDLPAHPHARPVPHDRETSLTDSRPCSRMTAARSSRVCLRHGQR